MPAGNQAPIGGKRNSPAELGRAAFHQPLGLAGAARREESPRRPVPGWSAGLGLIGFWAPLFQFLAAIFAGCSGLVPLSCMRRVAHIAKKPAGRITSSISVPASPAPDCWIM